MYIVQSTIHISSVIRQKGESQNGCFKKNKARQIFRKTIISYTYVSVSGGKKCSFFGKFGVLCFYGDTRFEICPFAFITDEIRNLRLPQYHQTSFWLPARRLLRLPEKVETLHINAGRSFFNLLLKTREKTPARQQCWI